jgi:hypothetical protein
MFKSFKFGMPMLLQMLYLISSSNSSSNSNEDSSNIVNKVIVTMAVIVLVTAMLIAMKTPNCCAFTAEYQELQCSTVTPIYCNPEINRKRLIHLYIASLILFTTILLLIRYQHAHR